MKKFFLTLIFLTGFALAHAQSAPRPNILWITSEDNGPQLGCYGDAYATTPNLDALAAKGMIYRNAWSTAPVCAPARTVIISGLYHTSSGGEHMRSMVSLPAGFKMYPQFLREAGYYCTNNSKEDYNLRKPGEVWHESSGKAHWKNRQPGQPFFAIFNYTISHESQVRKRPHEAVHDPAKVRVPAYHPDTPEVRQDWAQYYDKITEMDALAGKALKELEEAGLAEDTIVFYYGDHGAGMPRSKRWPYNSGLHVPLIVHVPAKFKHLAPSDYQVGGKSEQLVGFIDLAPTVLSLVGVKPPEWMQGRAFMGQHTAPAPAFLHGARGRMDERFDLIRSVRDGRYIYIRNYLPHLPYGQFISYMFQTPTTQVWKQLYDEGNLRPPQTYFWETKPAEELYDLQTDPDEVKNLANSPAHQDVLKRLRQAQRDQVFAVRDVTFLPEGEMHRRSENSTPYEMARDEAKYPLKRIFETAELASSLKPEALPALRQALTDGDSAVRYWGAMGLLMCGESAVPKTKGILKKALSDESPNVRIVAAQALGQFGGQADVNQALPVLVELANAEQNGVFTAMAALNALEALGPKAAPALDQILALPEKGPSPDGRYNSYVPRLVERITAVLQPGTAAAQPVSKPKRKAK